MKTVSRSLPTGSSTLTLLSRFRHRALQIFQMDHTVGGVRRDVQPGRDFVGRFTLEIETPDKFLILRRELVGSCIGHFMYPKSPIGCKIKMRLPSTLIIYPTSDKSR